MWCYGEELRSIGDDRTALQLGQITALTRLMHTRTWLEYVAAGARESWSEVEKHWDKTN